jgi:hypothetical protein
MSDTLQHLTLHWPNQPPLEPNMITSAPERKAAFGSKFLTFSFRNGFQMAAA